MQADSESDTPRQPPLDSHALLLARIEAADSAGRALALAAGVIADANCSERNLRLRQMLLRESMISAASALTGNIELRSLQEAIAALGAQIAFVPIALDPVPHLDRAIMLSAATVPEVEALGQAERLIGELLRTAHSGRYVVKKRHRLHWVVVAVLGMVVSTVVSIPFWPKASTASYSWRASSAISDFKESGTLGEMGPVGLQFHTKDEAGPWIIVDMLKPRSIDRVVLNNRTDCCRERGLPMVIEVGLETGSFEEVARRTDVFDVWTAPFTARQARYVRIRSTSSTILHLASIRIP